jgi:hypothetical protein
MSSDPNAENIDNRDDDPFPEVGRLYGSMDVNIEEGRIRMREEEDTAITVAVANNQFDDPSPVCTIYSRLSVPEDVYAEIAFDDMEQVRYLRDALGRALKRRGGTDD